MSITAIASPNDVHPEIALAAIAVGKHVYCEKPLANTAGEARAMRYAVNAARVTTVVGFNYLCNPVQTYSRGLTEGASGYVESTRPHRPEVLTLV